ncbi:MAG: prepilin-type N-terminal cleavage/methylation domain-containing protein [Pseudomonadota bacterium]
MQSTNTSAAIPTKGFSLIELMAVVLVVGVISSIALATYSNYINTAHAQAIVSNFETAVETAQNNYVAAEQLATTGASVDRVVPPDSAGWVDLLNSTRSSAPAGGDAYEEGAGDDTRGSIGLVFAGTFANGDSTVTINRPAFAGMPAASTQIAQSDF